MVKKAIPKKVENAINKYIRVLKADRLPISQVFLFGSYASGKQNKWSDIDLCIISPQFKDTWQALQYLWSKRVSDKGITIEPIGYNPKDFKESSLIQEIKKKGLEIKV